MARMSRRDLIAAFAAAAALPGGARAAGLPPRKASPLSVRQLHSGHSLSDAYGSGPHPGRLTLATSATLGRDASDLIGRSIIPGSPLHWRWDNATPYPDARKDIGAYQLLVTTEGAPLLSEHGYFEETTLASLDLWIANTARKGNRGRGAELMLYSTWVRWDGSEPNDWDGGRDLPFRDRLDQQGALWEAMQDFANARRPDGMPPVYMIPGHRLMARLADDIAGGRAPGLRKVSDLFGDSIHLRAPGQYAIACLVYAVIYQRNPAKIPDRLCDDDDFSGETARYLKAAAWDVAVGYRRAGIG
jgi:hypothetical protein